MNLALENLKQATAFLPDKVRYPISAINQNVARDINELRIRKNYPLVISSADKRLFLRYNGEITDSFSDQAICIVDNNDVDDAVRKLCNYSIHAFQNELKNGFMTIFGGHRVGIVGTAVIGTQGEISAIKNVTSLNIRIARQIEGAADEIFSNVFRDKVRSVLVVGEPSSGKTTILRDIANRLSGAEFGYLSVAIIDERSEIALANNYIEKGTYITGCDVLNAYPKAEGMMIALRAMSPDVIICDEIGSEKDAFAIESVSNAGVILIASIHADSFSSLIKRPQFQRLMSTAAFETAVLLSGRDFPGKIKEIVNLRRYWK